MEKQWKPYGPLYEISSDGEVRNVKSNKILKERYTREGYVHYNLYRKNKKIHRLLGEFFVPNPENLPCLNHIDGNKTNNHYSNLEWCTQGHNLKESYRLGLTEGPSKKLRAYRDGILIGEFKSGYAAARHLGLGLSTPSVSMHFGQPMYGYTFEKA